MEKRKYPRTPHLPWSPGATSDDKYIQDLNSFKGRKIVITEKMDGENTTIYPDGSCHARSLDSGYHASRSWIKQFAANIGPQINDKIFKKNWRMTGENVFAKHSIHYHNLKSYFYMFGFWELDICLEWNYTRDIANDNDITLVPVLYEGPFDELVLKALPATLNENQEGFVVRTIDNIHPFEWDRCVAKWVRPNHVQTDKHWMQQNIIKNELEVL